MRTRYLDMNEIIPDTRCYTFLGLGTLLFVDSSSHIWSSQMIQSGIGDPFNLIRRFISFSFSNWTNYSCTSLSKLLITIQERTRISRNKDIQDIERNQNLQDTKGNQDIRYQNVQDNEELEALRYQRELRYHELGYRQGTRSPR